MTRYAFTFLMWSVLLASVLFAAAWLTACSSSSSGAEDNPQWLSADEATSDADQPAEAKPQGCGPGEKLRIRPSSFMATSGLMLKDPASYQTVVRNPTAVMRDDRALNKGDLCTRIQDSEYECVGRILAGDTGQDLVRLSMAIMPGSAISASEPPLCIAGVVYLQTPRESDLDRAYTEQQREASQEFLDQDVAIHDLMEAKGLLKNDEARPPH